MSNITPVAHIYTSFPTKFGIPRQSGLTDCISKIVLCPPYNSPEAVRGLEGYSHLWLIWEFTESKGKAPSLTVRPPRLGGNTRMGVFATRSPFRPNNLGLSSVEIERIEIDEKSSPVIYVKGADILDGTPIFDIKPYLPFTDCHPEARDGFAGEVFSDRLDVTFDTENTDIMPENQLKQLTDILSQDPRPHYHNDPDRIYAFEFSSYKIKFRVLDNTLIVTEIENI